MYNLVVFIFKKYFIDFFSERKREGTESQKHQWERNIDQPPPARPPTGDVPATKVHALDWNRTWNLSVCRPTLYPLSQKRLGQISLFLKAE